MKKGLKIFLKLYFVLNFLPNMPLVKGEFIQIQFSNQANPYT